MSYFKNRFVQEPEEKGNGQYEAIVQGSNDYTVLLTIENGTIVEYFCDCPYDMGPVCKHVVAVIFYIQQDELNLTETTKTLKSANKKSSSKNKSVSKQVNEILEIITHQELKQFVRDKVAQNVTFSELFLSTFARLNSDESKEVYLNQLRSIRNKSIDRYGFVDQSSSSYFINATDNIISYL